MDALLEEIAFLARSENRMAILRALNERARDRRDLQAETEVSRSTLGRVLDELQERDWIERDGQAYETTTAGELVLDRFVPLLETVGGLHTLGDGLEYVPIEKMALDVRHFADARFITQTDLQPTRPYDYGIDQLRDADQLWCVARTAPPPYVTAFHEEVTAGRLDATFVLDGAYLDSLPTDGEMRAQWHDLATGSAIVQRHEGPIPYIVLVLDETIHLWLCEEDGDTIGLLES
jgi:predicted transcriptional regulator